MQRSAPLRMLPLQRHNGLGIRAIAGQSGIGNGCFGCPTQRNRIRPARPPFNPSAFRCKVQRVLRHAAIRRPFATGNRDQPARGRRDQVLAGELCRACGIPAHQRSQSGEDAANLRLPDGPLQVGRNRFHQKRKLLPTMPRFHRNPGYRNIRGSNHALAHPRNREDQPPIPGLRNHQRIFPAQNAAGHHKMRPAAGLEQRQAGGILHLPQLVQKDSARIHNHPRAHLHLASALGIAHPRAARPPVALHQRHAPGIVQHRGTTVLGRARQCQRIAGIIKLPVKIQHAAQQSFRVDPRHGLLRPARTPDLRCPQRGAARQQLIRFQSRPIERQIHPAIRRRHKPQPMHQVGSIAQHDPPLTQRLIDQMQLSICQVANPAMHQLRGPAGGGLRKITRLDQRRAKSPCCRIHGNAQPGGSSANHQHVAAFRQPIPFLRAFHPASLPQSLPRSLHGSPISILAH